MDPISDSILSSFDEKMEKSIAHLRDQLGGIRTGRASPALVDTLRVDYYGTPTPVNQLAAISVPEARQLLLKPFDASIMKELEKAILTSDLGLSPQSDGKTLRLTLPPLSGEQRQKLVAKVKDLAETAKVALRNERRDANKHADQAKKDGNLSEDGNKDLHDEIQERLKSGEAQIEEILKAKTSEILED